MRHRPSRWGKVLLLLVVASIACAAQKPSAKSRDDGPPLPSAGPLATVLVRTPLYIYADTHAQMVARVQAGREMVVVETNGPWMRVFANTDAPTENRRDAPLLGDDSRPVPVTGWLLAKNVLVSTTPGGDLVLMGQAAIMESLASDARGPRDAGQAARLLYLRLLEFYPDSHLAPEAAWRAADIRWQFDKADLAQLPSSKEKEAYLREQIDESEMKKIMRMWPGSRQADLAAWDLLDNKVCGTWQGDPRCPGKEAGLYEDYASQHPKSPHVTEALYQAAYRAAAVHDIEAAAGDEKKAADALKEAQSIEDFLMKNFPHSDYASRTAALVYEMQHGIVIYGTESN
jgi:hypothetical protein